MTSIPPPQPAPEPATADGAEANAPPEDEPDWRIWMVPAAIVMGLALGELAVIIVDVIGAAAGSSFAHPSPAVSIVGNVVVDLAFVAAALYFASTRPPMRASDFGFRRVGLRRGAIAVVSAGVGYYGLTAVYAEIFKLHGQDKLPSELGVSRSDAALVAAAVFVCVIAPIAEEFFFRGFLFGALRRWRVRVAGREIGTWLAAVVVGVLFGLAHTGSASPEYLVPLGFLGFVLCLIRWRTRSLYPCMALHAFNNSLALGVNQLHWPAWGIVGLIAAALLAIAATTGPLSSPLGRSPAYP
jgi:membrane protease YdiL (CAAX protease family)